MMSIDGKEPQEQCGYIGLHGQAQCNKPAYLRLAMQPSDPDADRYAFCEYHAGAIAALLSQEPRSSEDGPEPEKGIVL